MLATPAPQYKYNKIPVIDKVEDLNGEEVMGKSGIYYHADILKIHQGFIVQYSVGGGKSSMIDYDSSQI